MTLQTEFRNAMAQLGSAVSVITTDGPAGKFGFTASAVCSVTDSPPTLLVCMNRNSFANEHFKQNGALCVNVLSSDHQHLSGVFANASLRSEQRFEYDSWQVMASGAPTPVMKWVATPSSTARCRRSASAKRRAGWSTSTVAIMPSGMTWKRNTHNKR